MACRVLAKPATFFAGLGGPRPGRVKGPLVFAMIHGVVSSPLALLLDPSIPGGAGSRA